MDRDSSAARSASTSTTRRLLACGALAGPLFVTVAFLQVLLRPGFDLRRHPLSMLSLGDLGWIQIANFVLSGVLAIVLAFGMRRVLHPGRAGTWGPLLVGFFGVGLIAGGVFVADPALGFPPGAPEGIPERLSWHATVHAFAPPLAFLALIAACFVLVRRFAASRESGWALYSAITGVVALVLAAWPAMDGMSVRLAVATVVGWAWASALAVRLMREPASAAQSIAVADRRARDHGQLERAPARSGDA